MATKQNKETTMRTTVRQRWINLSIPLLFALGMLLVIHTLMSSRVFANEEHSVKDSGERYLIT